MNPHRPDHSLSNRDLALAHVNGIDAVAERAGTIAYEILTSLGGRHARRYIGG